LKEKTVSFSQALRINPEDAGAWNMFGLTYNVSGNRSAALGVVKELRHLDPAMADALFNLIVPR
jgi:lipoprotein NlpI